MLSGMVKEHQARQQIRREEQERRRKEALQASTNLTNALVDHLNVGVAQAYLNQKRLDGEARRLEQSAAVLQKQTQHWITLVNGFCSALKQVGDVAAWTQAIHQDVSTVAATLQEAYTTTYIKNHRLSAPVETNVIRNTASSSSVGPITASGSVTERTANSDKVSVEKTDTISETSNKSCTANKSDNNDSSKADNNESVNVVNKSGS